MIKIKIIIVIILVILCLLCLFWLIKTNNGFKFNGGETTIASISNLLNNDIVFKNTKSDLLNYFYIIKYNNVLNNNYLHNNANNVMAVVNQIIINEYTGNNIYIDSILYNLQMFNCINKIQNEITNLTREKVIDHILQIMSDNDKTNILVIDDNDNINESILISLVGLEYNYYSIKEGSMCINCNLIPKVHKRYLKIENKDMCCVAIPSLLYVNYLNCLELQNYYKINVDSNVFYNLIYPMSNNDINELNHLHEKIIDDNNIIMSDIHGKFIDLLRILIIHRFIGYCKCEIIDNNMYYLYVINPNISKLNDILFLGDIFNYKLMVSENTEKMTYDVAQIYRLINIFDGDNDIKVYKIKYVRGNHCRNHLMHVFDDYDDLKQECLNCINDNIIKNNIYNLLYDFNKFNNDINNFNINGYFIIYSTDYIKPLKDKIYSFIIEFINHEYNKNTNVNGDGIFKDNEFNFSEAYELFE